MTSAIDTLQTDPETAALELLVPAAETATGSTGFRAVLQDLAGLLHAEEALAGLAWVDARLVAAAVSFDIARRRIRSGRCAVVPQRCARAAAR
ncbi:amino acid aminotransferase, partial [Mycobacterium intracellulare]